MVSTFFCQSSDTSQRKLFYLSLCPPFSYLDVEQRSEIASHFVVRRYQTEQIILRAGDTSTHVYFIACGSVRTTMISPLGKEIYYQDLSTASMFGELSAIDGLPRTTDVIAVEDCVLLVLGREKFQQLMKSYPVIAEAVQLKLAGLVRFLCARVYQYSALDVSSRVRLELLRLAQNEGAGNDGEFIITKMPTHQELANRLATHREAVTRELRSLHKQGIVQRKQHTLTILDMTLLESLIPGTG